MRKFFAAAFLSFNFLCAVTGCAELGLQTAQSFDQKLAYSYGTVSSLRVSAASALMTGSITKQDAEHVQALADQARMLLDSARATTEINLQDANARLVLASSILIQLQTYLATRGVK